MRILEKVSSIFAYKKLIKRYEKELVRINHDRLTTILVILYSSQWIVYFYSSDFLNVDDVVIKFQIFLTLFIPILIVTNIKFKHIPIIAHEMIMLVGIIGIYIFCMAVIFNTEDHGSIIHIFLIATMGIGSFFYMPPRYSIFIIGIPTAIFRISIINMLDSALAEIYIFNAIVFNSLALVLSINLFSMKIRDLVNRDEITKHNSKLKKLSKIDQMTSLFNHKAIFDILSKEIDYCKRHKEELVIMMFDIDDFKKINDQHGHIYGDEVIIEVAKSLKEAVRYSDFVGRYGGEEFIVITPKNSLDGALKIYKRLCFLLHEKYKDKKSEVTLSCGFARYENHSLDELINLADKRLYIAKKSGKNKCVVDD